MAPPRLLIVDDSDSIRTTLRLTLEFKGYEIEEASDGLEGYEKLRAGSYDLVLTDLAMPGVGGVELVRKIRGELGLDRLPVVVLSAEERELKAKALTAGANDCIDKPFAPQQIFDVVERLLASRD